MKSDTKQQVGWLFHRQMPVEIKLEQKLKVQMIREKWL